MTFSVFEWVIYSSIKWRGFRSSFESIVWPVYILFSLTSYFLTYWWLPSKHSLRVVHDACCKLVEKLVLHLPETFFIIRSWNAGKLLFYLMFYLVLIRMWCRCLLRELEICWQCLRFRFLNRSDGSCVLKLFNVPASSMQCSSWNSYAALRLGVFFQFFLGKRVVVRIFIR